MYIKLKNYACNETSSIKSEKSRKKNFFFFFSRLATIILLVSKFIINSFLFKILIKFMGLFLKHSITIRILTHGIYKIFFNRPK